jgi:hypothetical protein
MAIKKESTHQLIHRNLTLYQREHSAVWQCRYKVDNKWIRATTKETQLDLAVNRALAKQMGTSVLMIERHYSHLQVIQAIEQLRGANTRKLIEADSKAADNYPSKKRAERERHVASL